MDQTEEEWAGELENFLQERRAAIASQDVMSRNRSRGGFGGALQIAVDKAKEDCTSITPDEAPQVSIAKIDNAEWNVRKAYEKLTGYCDIMTEATPEAQRMPEDLQWKFRYDSQVNEVKGIMRRLRVQLEAKLQQSTAEQILVVDNEEDEMEDPNATIVPPGGVSRPQHAATASAPPLQVASAATTPAPPIQGASTAGPSASSVRLRDTNPLLRTALTGGMRMSGGAVTIQPSSASHSLAQTSGTVPQTTFFTSTINPRSSIIPPFPKLDAQNQSLLQSPAIPVSNPSMLPNLRSSRSSSVQRNLWPQLSARVVGAENATAAPTTLNYLQASENNALLGGLLGEQTEIRAIPNAATNFEGTEGRDAGGAGARASEQNAGARNEGEASAISSLLSIYSQSIASQFSSSTIITRKFCGEPDYFETWWALWSKCHHIMIKCGFEKSTMFLELLSSIGGTCKNLVSGLSITAESSYELACRTIFAAYNERTQSLRNHIYKFVTMGQSTGSMESRLKMHSNLVSYVTSIESLGCTANECLLGWELSCLLEKLDENLHKKFCRYLEKQRNPSTPLGYNIDINSMISELHKMIIDEQKFNTLNWQAIPANASHGG